MGEAGEHDRLVVAVEEDTPEPAVADDAERSLTVDDDAAATASREKPPAQSPPLMVMSAVRVIVVLVWSATPASSPAASATVTTAAPAGAVIGAGGERHDRHRSDGERAQRPAESSITHVLRLFVRHVPTPRLGGKG